MHHLSYPNGRLVTHLQYIRTPGAARIEPNTLFFSTPCAYTTNGACKYNIGPYWHPSPKLRKFCLLGGASLKEPKIPTCLELVAWNLFPITLLMMTWHSPVPYFEAASRDLMARARLSFLLYCTEPMLSISSTSASKLSMFYLSTAMVWSTQNK